MKRWFLAPIALIIMLFVSTGAAATTLCVNPTGSGNCFASIQDAVDNAVDGDTIRIRKGVYNENVYVDVDNLRLQGDSQRNTIIDGDDPNSGVVLYIDADGVTVQKLFIRNGEDHGIEAYGNDLLITQVFVKGAEDDCIYLEGDDAVIQHSELVGCGGDEAIIYLEGDNALIQQNVIMLADEDCIELYGDYANIYKNRISLCEDGYGVYAEGDDLMVNNNTVHGTDDGSIYLEGDNPQVNNNTVSMDTSDGIDVDCSNDCSSGEIRNNKISDMIGDASCIVLEAYGTSSNMTRVENNICNRAMDYAFDIEGDYIHVSRNKAHTGGGDYGEYAFYIYGDDNVVENNRAELWHSHGFYIEGDYNLVKRNDSRRNIADGFIVDGDDNMLEDNVARENLGTGIEIDSGSNNVLDGNHSSDNRLGHCDDGTGTVDLGNNRFDTVGACGGPSDDAPANADDKPANQD